MERDKSVENRRLNSETLGRRFRVLQRWKDPEYAKVVLVVVFSLAAALLITPSFRKRPPTYRVGDVATHNIKADRDFLLLDQEATKQKRQSARQDAPLIFDLHEKAAQTAALRLSRAFKTLRGALHDAFLHETGGLMPDHRVRLSVRSFTTTTDAGELPMASFRAVFEEALGFPVPENIYLILAGDHFSLSLEERLIGWLHVFFEEGILPGAEDSELAALLSPPPARRAIQVRMIPSLRERTVASLNDFTDIHRARERATTRILQQERDIQSARAVAYLCAHLLEPNLFFNRLETQQAESAAAEAVKPVYVQIKKNEMIIRDGQRLSEEDLHKLEAYASALPRKHALSAFLAIWLFSALFLAVLWHMLSLRISLVRLDFHDYVFLASVLLVVMVLCRTADWLSASVGEQPGYFDHRSFLYAVPIAAGAMLASIFFGLTVAVFFSLAVSFFAALVCGNDFQVFVFALLGSLVGSYGVNPCRNRLVPIRAGLLTGATNAACLTLLALFQEHGSSVAVLTNAFLGFMGGIVSGVLATGFTPLAELLFGYTTDIRLLELASMDQPLLQELMIQAPGTYHHSLIVGNMTEAAAKSIGANSLLAKVAGYYHDIGKIKKPLYFIENQFDAENRHERLAPSMSSLILISHVKDGVELARKHRLGKPIMDIIRQHHGKSLISYFYQKALESREKTRSAKGAELPPINIDDYRYPGPKPQTKEAGLVMLADMVEAACRSLTEPTPARIQGMVSRLINSAFTDGQLDECELTLKDLHQIAKHFHQILATVHHKRIEYPAQAGPPKGKSHGTDSHQRELRPDKDRPGTTAAGSRTDLKRLGLQ
ncbi:MAG: HD family phosphohydrolase [Desulfosoma sp.]|uniref:HD family phosphohydrolase n=1 Tax=Desulfosoma sp. TaxID=2603217 RepID=UPI00404A0ED7